MQLIKSGFRRIHELPGAEVKSFLGHLGEAGLKHITIETNDGDDAIKHSDLEGAETAMQVDILSYLPDLTHDGDVTFTQRIQPGLPDTGIGAARIFLSTIACAPETKYP
ncbi:MAG TPA: hypothetical protein VLG11_03310 [Candidatus Saccharimonadales bacterium]|nr:hypothetical protein [Candidatus Saccharimonadales bacterium]